MPMVISGVVVNSDRRNRYWVLYFYVNGETSAGFMLALVPDSRSDIYRLGKKKINQAERHT
jgi:hypothetical protein